MRSSWQPSPSIACAAGATESMRLFAALLVAWSGCALSQDRSNVPASGAQAAPPVNVVVLFSDDAGYADFGFQPLAEADMASLTPAIDRIAAEGLTLADFHTSASVCSPSRAGLLTGRYQQEFGHEQNLPVGNKQSGIAAAGRSLAERMRAAGRTTGFIGKWHLGYREEDHPNRVGWDWFYGCLQGSRPYTAMEQPSALRVIQENGEPTPEGGYVTDRFGDAAVRFLEEHREEPFFLFVSFTAPHGPLQARPEDLERPELARIEGARRRNYAGLVVALDDNVSKVLDALETLDLAEDTLVVFTNDNGGQTQTGAMNTPLRGRKGMLTEGGLRVPAAVRWPRRIEAGGVSQVPSTTLDLAPTLLAAVGSKESGDPALDGRDLLAHWTARAEVPDAPLFWRQGGSSGPRAVRLGPWKLLQEERDAPPQLFEVPKDLGEAKDLAAEHPQRVAQLAALLDAWEEGLVEPLFGATGK